MEKKYLFLDDVRVPETVCNYLPDMCDFYSKNKWAIVRSYDAFVLWVNENGLPYHMSLDHDLADVKYDVSTQTESFKYHEKTGLDCVKWVVDYCIDNKIKLPEYTVHSQNPVGNENMKSMLNNFKNFQNVL